MLVCARRLLLFPLLFGLALGRVNRTIDDAEGDSVTGAQPIYFAPPGYNWNYGPTCLDCYVKPNASQCFDNSWHDMSIFPSAHPAELPYINLTFVGTAVYVFAIVPNTVVNATTTVDVAFTLDDNPAGSYFHNPNSSTVYEYNVLIYSNESMPNGQHTLQVELQVGTEGSYFAFDYVKYTVEATSGTGTSSATGSQTASATPLPSQTNTKRSSSTGAIVGGVIGGIASVAALVLAAFCIRRRRGGVGAAQRSSFCKGSDIESRKIDPFRPDMSQSVFPVRPVLTTTLSSLVDPSPLSPLRDVAVLSPGALLSPIAAQSRKSAERQQELARLRREMEQTMASLNARRAEEALSPTLSNATRTAARGSADEALRSQVEALQIEVERLKAAQEAAMEPPPAY